MEENIDLCLGIIYGRRNIRRSSGTILRTKLGSSAHLTAKQKEINCKGYLVRIESVSVSILNMWYSGKTSSIWKVPSIGSSAYGSLKIIYFIPMPSLARPNVWSHHKSRMRLKANGDVDIMHGSGPKEHQCVKSYLLNAFLIANSSSITLHVRTFKWLLFLLERVCAVIKRIWFSLIDDYICKNSFQLEWNGSRNRE